MKKIKAKLVIDKSGERMVLEKEAYSLAEIKDRIDNYLETLIISEKQRISAERAEREFSRFSALERTSEGEFIPEFLPKWLKNYDLESLSQKEKLLLLIKHEHANEWIRSQELREEYRDIFGEDIKLSSISTYLARFYEEGLLKRRGSRAQREYFLGELATA